MTNIEKIRSMSEEELATFIFNLTECCNDASDCDKCFFHGLKCYMGAPTILEWLKKEEEDGRIN